MGRRGAVIAAVVATLVSAACGGTSDVGGGVGSPVTVATPERSAPPTSGTPLPVPPLASPTTTVTTAPAPAPAVAPAPVPAPTTTRAARPPAVATVAPSTTAPRVAVTTPPATAPAPPRVRNVVQQAWTPFAATGPLTLLHPSSRVERVAFHEASHDGAQDMGSLPTAVAAVRMEARSRGTAPQSAADIVVDPAVEIRAPVTGTVKRAGTYVLYCRHSDDYAVIEPDDRPGWEVKVLHISGVLVRAGDRVVAGRTVLAPGPTPLPFQSQVDELRTADPAWPHVHVEVVDPSIPDRAPPGGGCP